MKPLVLLLLVAGCGSAATHPVVARNGPAAPTVFVGHGANLAVGSVSATSLGMDDEAFGLRLLHDVCGAAPTANTSLSPASAAQALGLLQTGARGSAQSALAKLLQQPAYGPDVLAAQHQRTAGLATLPGVSISNRLFEQVGVNPAQATLDDLATAYATRLQTVDFAGDPVGSTKAVNDAVSADTHGLVPSLFDSPLDPSTVAALTNAIYLHETWPTPFASAPGPFTTASGTVVTVATLSGGETGRLGTADGWTSVALPYEGGQLTAVAMLPPRATPACSVPTASALGSLLTADRGEGLAQLPAFHLSTTSELLAPLAHEGLEPMGDYSGLGADTISEVVQKVDIDVDEKGTVAAAATGITAFLSSEVVGPAPTLVTFDRPFLFLVMDDATHTPLFLTRLADPRA